MAERPFWAGWRGGRLLGRLVVAAAPRPVALGPRGVVCRLPLYAEPTLMRSLRELADAVLLAEDPEGHAAVLERCGSWGEARAAAIREQLALHAAEREAQAAAEREARAEAERAEAVDEGEDG